MECIYCAQVYAIHSIASTCYQGKHVICKTCFDQIKPYSIHRHMFALISTCFVVLIYILFVQ